MESCRTDLKVGEPAKAELSWSDLLTVYRNELSRASATALLDRLGPWLTNAQKALLAAPPFADADDIAQQLRLEVLAKAARWVPRCEDQWIPRRLAEQAERRVRRRLRRERMRESVELDDQLPSNAPEDPFLLDTPIGRASVADIRLIYRYHVAGESLDDLARWAGITPRQMRRRIQRAKERART